MGKQTNPLGDYLRRYTFLPPPSHGQQPAETLVIPFGTFDLKGTRLGFCDTWMVPEGVAVTCEPGRYALEALCLCYGTDARVARVSARRAGEHGQRGPSCGTFGVDVGSACIFDFDVMEHFADRAPAAVDRWGQKHIVDDPPHFSGTVACRPARTSIVFFDSGFGDGIYTVYELRGDQGIVGAEAVFLEPDHPYPFGQES